MWPRFSSSRFISTWITLTLAASLVSIVDGGWLASWTALAPARIWHGEVWRLATWILVERDPWSLVITCIAIYKFGGELAGRWGERRLRRVVAEIVLAAAVLTTLCALLSDAAWLVRRCGGWAVGDILCIAWARTFPERMLWLYYGMLRLRGRALIRVVVGITLVYALFAGIFPLLPELLCCTFAAIYPASRWRH